MRIYRWEEIENETGVSRPRIKYALAKNRIKLPKMKHAYILNDDAMLTIIRFFKDKPKFKHLKDEGKA